MCTVIVAKGVARDARLVLAHNRDELLARPSSDVAIWTPDGGHVPVVAGRDLHSGGTWFAIGPHTIACVTNDRRRGRPMPGPVSRGRLVIDAATAHSVDEAVRRISAVPAADVGPFHLLVTDVAHMVHVTNDGGEMRVKDVDDGLHVLGNFDLDDASDPVVRRVRASLDEVAAGGPSASDLEDAMRAVLRAHGEGGPCVHLGGYGTRTAGLITVGGATRSFSTTEGPSCTSAWRDQTALLDAIRPPVAPGERS